MPVIPKRRRSSIGKSVSRAELQNPAFAGQEYQALQRLGKTVQKTAQDIDAINTQVAVTDAKTKMLDIRNGEGGIISSSNELKATLSVNDPTEYYDNYSNWLDHRQEIELEKAGDNKYLRKEIEHEFTTFGALEREKAAQFARTETLKLGKQRIADTHTSFVREMTGTGDEKLFKIRLAEGKSHFTENTGILYSPVEAELMSGKFERNMMKGLIAGNVKGDNYAGAKDLVNKLDVFGTDAEKQAYLNEIDSKEEEFDKKQVRIERAEVVQQQRENKKVSDKMMRTLTTMDLTNPANVKFYQESLANALDAELIKGTKYTSMMNAMNRKVSGNASSDIFDLVISGENPEANVLLQKNREFYSPSEFKSMYNYVNKSAKTKAKMSSADKINYKSFQKLIKDSNNIFLAESYDKFVKKKPVSDAIIMAKFEQGLLDNKPSRRWKKAATLLPDDNKEFSRDNITEALILWTMDGKKGNKRKADRMRNLLRLEERRLQEYDKARDLLDSFGKLKNMEKNK